VAALQRLTENEARLGQWALRRVHQQHDPVDHRQRALDLAAEIRVPRRVHDVDQVIVIVNRRVLGENRDAPLALELVRVHDPLGHALVRPEDSALVQQRVDERGLAVIDMGDDRDVAKGRVGHLLRVQRRARHLTSIDR
jgi:hypothetical protein